MTKKQPYRIAVLNHLYFGIYFQIANHQEFLRKKTFTAVEVITFIRKNGNMAPAKKSVQILFDEKILIATNPATDKSVRINLIEKSGSKLPLTTALMFNPRAAVICTERESEVQFIQTFLTTITRKNGTVNFKLAKKMEAEVAKESERIVRQMQIMYQCIHLLNTEPQEVK